MTAQYVEEGRVHVLQDKHIPDYVTIFRIHGPFLFGTTDKLQGVVDGIAALAPIVIFRLRNMTAIDATGLRALEDLTALLRATGRTAIFCGAREQPRAVMEQAGFIEMVGAENVCPNVDAALARARTIHDRLPKAS